MSEYAIERSRHAIQVQRLDHQPCIQGLAPGPRADKAAQVLQLCAVSLGGLPLQAAEGSKLTLTLYNPFDPFYAQRANELVLEVGVAHIEAQPLHVFAPRVGAVAGSLESAPEIVLLTDVDQAGQLHARVGIPQLLEKPLDGV